LFEKTEGGREGRKRKEVNGGGEGKTRKKEHAVRPLKSYTSREKRRCCGKL